MILLTLAFAAQTQPMSLGEKTFRATRLTAMTAVSAAGAYALASGCTAVYATCSAATESGIALCSAANYVTGGAATGVAFADMQATACGAMGYTYGAGRLFSAMVTTPSAITTLLGGIGTLGAYSKETVSTLSSFASAWVSTMQEDAHCLYTGASQ